MGELASDGEDFGFETTLAGRTYARLLTGLKRDGYGQFSQGSQKPDGARKGKG